MAMPGVYELKAAIALILVGLCKSGTGIACVLFHITYFKTNVYLDGRHIFLLKSLKSNQSHDHAQFSSNNAISAAVLSESRLFEVCSSSNRRSTVDLI